MAINQRPKPRPTALHLRLSPRTLTNVSIMANVASVARLLFKMVASMYKPFSVNAFGMALLLGEIVADEIFESIWVLEQAAVMRCGRNCNPPPLQDTDRK